MQSKWHALIHPPECLIEKTDNTKCWQGCRTTGLLIHCWCKYKHETIPFGKLFNSFKNIRLPYGPAIPLLGIYARDMSVYVHKIHRRIVIETLFIVVQNWKQLKCAKIGTEINKLY